MIITGAGDNAAARQADERDKGVSFKNCAPFTSCTSEFNNTQVDNAEDIGIVMQKRLEACDSITKISQMII